MSLPDPATLDRRTFLAAAAAAAAAGTAHRVFGGDILHAQSEGPQLVIRNPRPLDAETPLEAMRTQQTPNDLFFVRSHFGHPTQLPATWKLTVDGDVSQPLSLGLEEIKAITPRVTQDVTLECAGNGRGLMRLPSTSGVQWQRGAVSNARWTGIHLSTLLERAVLGPQAAHLWLEGADSAGEHVPRFVRSLPREAALHNALLVWEMNGEAIPLLHGGPLRLLMPGWYGMASTKWLTRIHAAAQEADNPFMAKSYRYPDGSPVQRMRVKSVITDPLEGARVRAGSLRVAGVAWTGGVPLTSVEVSADGGRSWLRARLGRGGVFSWRQWELQLPMARAGRYTLQARATDASGAVQPLRAEPNPPGYGNNSIHEVSFHVAG